MIHQKGRSSASTSLWTLSTCTTEMQRAIALIKPLHLSSIKMAPLKETTPAATRMAYRIGRGEQGVLTFEPYKSHILPLWRFRTVPVARKSADDLWSKFLEFDRQDDFVGMDMTRKFIQMGYTRAKRYANHAGGRKYDKQSGEELPKSESHGGKEEKEAASLVFKERWEKCKAHKGYLHKKEMFLEKQKSWFKEHPEHKQSKLK